MDKLHPSSRHLDSSVAHRTVQPSTILDRRYVKRPTSSSAGRYSSAHRMPSHDGAAAPSRLINLGVHATDLEVAQISAAIREEITPTEDPEETPAENLAEMNSNSYADAAEPAEDYYTEDSLSAELDNDYADETAAMPAEDYYAPAEESVSPEASSEPDSQPVSMYTLEAMKQNMMQDLINGCPTAVDREESTDMANAAYAIPSPASETTPETMAAGSAAYSPNYAEEMTPDPSANESLDVISKATSDALASIRIATESAEVSEQMASLKAFADSIKSDSPEMSELSNTIEKFANVAMKSSKAKAEAENKVAMNINRSAGITSSASRINRSPASSATAHSTASRHLAARSAAPTVSRRPQAANRGQVSPARTASPQTRTTNRSARSQSTAKKAANSRQLSPARSRSNLPDDRALEKALRSVATMDEPKSNRSTRHKRSRKVRRKGGIGRFALALGCAAACIAVVAYFVGSNIPDISVQVAAMQTGIDASYPSYVPREYSLGDISSEDGRLTMRFNGPDGASFTLIEEKSSWDSSALQRNYVEPTWGDNFTTTHEQGITIYISNSDAAWVNGGILYKIDASSNNLTKKQLRNIVTSM